MHLFVTNLQISKFQKNKLQAKMPPTLYKIIGAIFNNIIEGFIEFSHNQ